MYNVHLKSIEIPLTSVDPVNAILSTSMCSERAAPAVGPYPGTTLTTPIGKPAYLERAAKYKAVSGVSSDGLITTTFPVATAGANFSTQFTIGKFHWKYK